MYLDEISGKKYIVLSQLSHEGRLDHTVLDAKKKGGGLDFMIDNCAL